MSLPPITVHIKRKATDEPVDFLRVHESNGKRQRRATEFVFSRQVELVNDSTSSPVAAPKGVRRIKQLPGSTSSQSLSTQPLSSHTQTQEAGARGSRTKEYIEAGQPKACSPANSVLQTVPQNTAPTTPLSLKQQARRFHISRSASTTPPTQSVHAGRVQKRTTVFVERRARARISPIGSSSPFTPALTPEPEQAPAQKRPGLSARISTATANNTSVPCTSQLAPEPQNVRLPSGLIAPWSLDDQQLVDEMQAYTLQEIGHSIAEADAAKPGGSPAPTPIKKPSRFKPKIPKLRYHERHPEEFVNKGSDMEIEDLVEDIDDNSEYIIDTYIRMPIDEMEVDMNAEKIIGFLVLDGQSDIDEFYTAETESDDDEDCDEEDENAENHYTADYPDEEVESDDEYGRNPYQYAHDDAAFSDDSVEGTKYPWSKKPAWLRKVEHGSDDEDDDKDD